MLDEAGREEIQAYLKKPLDFPQEFKEWLRDFLAVNMPWIPISQVLGYRDSRIQASVVDTAEVGDASTGPERTWVDLPSDGPEITGLANGKYWVAWGGMMYEGGSVGNCDPLRIGLSENGADPTEWVSAIVNNPQGYPGARATVVDLSSGDNNSLKLQYYYNLNAGAHYGFANRWLISLRIN